MSENFTVTSSQTSAGVLSENAATSVLTVEQLNRQIRQLIEGDLGLVWVQGEISNFKAHSSGHFYFSLKDSKSQISAVMFRGHNSRLKFKPTDGLEVIVRGRVTVYEPRGNYQVVAETMEPVGAGALQKAFEQLKEKLKAEGLFESARKRAIPSVPRHIAIVTSPTGAAIRDMINVLTRRNRNVRITLVPTIVQGESAAPKIIEAMKLALQLPEVDVMIVGRGGGSIEDLWAFNDEKLARAIAASPIPVISAVGHEIDFTIADFVADLRAPTPSAAAELVVKNTSDLVSKLQALERLLVLSVNKHLKTELQKVDSFARRLVDPKKTLQNLMQRNDELFTRLNAGVLKFFKHAHLQLQILQGKLVTPDQVISDYRGQIDLLSTKLENEMQQELDMKEAHLKRMMSMLESMSPLKVVERGYSMTTKGKELIKSAKQAKVGDEIEIRLMEGSLKAQVTEVILKK
jgi:exodeoxyribonuclease VII large subunit